MNARSARPTNGSGAARRLRRPWWVVPVAFEVVSVAAVVLGLMACGAAGLSVARIVVTIVTTALTLSAVVMIVEVICSRRPQPPRRATGRVPAMTAIVAAYLPNEQLHLCATLEHLLALPCRGRLQVICAYNTPAPLAIEQELRGLALRHSRLTVLRVSDSTSKAANVNAALAVATGEAIAIFDADHRPQPGAFEQAWSWLAAGYDVVQGSCRVRDGGRSRLACVVAAEFDGMYGVTHPGRARVHGFAIFGGSNGYWRADVLRAVLLDPAMLTEDIDASIRALAGGARIAADPAIVSTELAPPTVPALWQQRLRWAQGWTQVSRSRLGLALASPYVRGRTRLGLVWQFGWCELLPWISTFGLGVLVHDVALGEARWGPLAASIALFNVAVGPLHALAGRARAPRGTRHATSWHLLYAVVSAVCYVEMLNLAKRIGQLRELGGRRRWVVTPRPQPEPSAEPTTPYPSRDTEARVAA